MNYAVIRASKIEEYYNKSNIGMSLNVFDHKNVYYDTKISHSQCTKLLESDFAKIKFDHDVPHLLNDFIVYITGGMVDLHDIYEKQSKHNKYMDRIASNTPNNKMLTHQIYTPATPEELDSVKFWNLVEWPENKPREDKSDIPAYEAYLKEK